MPPSAPTPPPSAESTSPETGSASSDAPTPSRLRRWGRALLPWGSAPALGAWVALLFVGAATWREAQIAPLPLVEEVENALLAWKFRMRGPIRPGADVVLAIVDERSLARFGRWPWSRTVFARLVKRLRAAGARSVAFDIIFDEPEIPPGKAQAKALLGTLGQRAASVGDPAVRWLKRLASSSPDERFADAVREAGNVLLGFFLFEGRAEAASAPPEVLDAARKRLLGARARLIKRAAALRERAPAGPERLWTAAGARAPVEPLARAAGKWMGYFNARPADRKRGFGILLGSEVEGRVYYALSVLAVSHFLGEYPILEYREHQPPRFLLADRNIPSDVHGRFYPNFYGPRGTFPRFSVADIVDGKVPPDRLRGKLVFVGATAIALPDNWPTPFDSALPGVEIHATVADNVLTKRFLRRPQWLTVLELGLLLLLGPLLAWGLSRARLGFGLVLALGAVVGAAGLDLYLFYDGYLVRSAFFYGEIGLVLLATYILLYFRVYRERRRLRTTMQHYLAPTVLAEVLRDQRQLQLGGEKRELTVLFSDIRGFTALSETTDARDLVAFLNEYFTPMTDVVLRHEGTFDKYMGDAIMAFFGAPQRMERHAAVACRAALDMRTELARLNARWRARGLPEVRIGIGLNTGVAAFGNMGSKRLFNYTVIGDHVNLASRVEGVSKLFGVTIVVTESTARAAQGAVLLRRLGRVYVAGKTEAANLFQVVGLPAEEERLRPWLEAFAAGLERFEARDLPAATEAFRAARSMRDDPASTAYLARIATLGFEDEWDPAWRSRK